MSVVGDSVRSMKLAVQVKLQPTPEQAVALEATLRACNQAANWMAGVAFERRAVRAFTLHPLVYAEARSRFGLGAQAAARTIKKTVDAYATLQALLRNGRLGKPGSERRTRVEGKPVRFRDDAAQPFDDRMLSWCHDGRTVSIWSVSGRLRSVEYVGAPEQLAILAKYRQGESDLHCRDGQWFLLATCEVPEADLNRTPESFLGVDLGIVNIATTSDGRVHAGRGLNRHRTRMVGLRAKLKKKGTKSAKRVLKRMRRRESRRATDVNHCIAKNIVAEAERTGRGIAVEDLTGICERVRFRKPGRAAVHSWAFFQLGAFLAYKARRAGVPLVRVDPAYTSQECSRCHHVERRNRLAQACFSCRSCGFACHADRNASQVIAARGWFAWVCGVPPATPALTLLA